MCYSCPRSPYMCCQDGLFMQLKMLCSGTDEIGEAVSQVSWQLNRFSVSVIMHENVNLHLPQ